MSNLENTVKDATSNVVSGTTELVGSTLNDFTVAINNLLLKVTSNQWLSTFIILFFVAYGSALGSGNKPPQFVTDLFKNPITRIVLLTIIAFEINKDLTMSVVLALAFYLTQQYIFQQESFDQIKNLEKFQNRYYLNKEKATKAN
jgi:hypothetical protein